MSPRERPDKIRAPYNFVPLATRPLLVEDEQAALVSHDVPLKDAICGVLDLQIIAETPIFVRGADDGQRFFRLPHGLKGIPGTSIRGMLRTVVEVATFSKLVHVNEHRFGVRDLNNPDVYRKYMAKADRKGLHPLVSAGWLSIEQGQYYDEDGSPRWQIRPCNFAKVEYAKLEAHAAALGVQGYRPGDRQSSVNKYRVWGQAPLTAHCRVLIRDRHGENGRVGDYGVVHELLAGAEDKTEEGRLVFTGQPNQYRPGAQKRRGSGNPKHHDFFFYGSQGQALEVPHECRRDFSFVHSNAGEQHRLDDDPNEEWKYWLQRLRNGKEVPVFFLMEEREPQKLRAFGLAMMFRLAYRFSPKELFLRGQDLKEKGPWPADMAELIFGHVPPPQKHLREGARAPEALAGRVSIEAAVEAGGAKEGEPVKIVLGAPKASYYPSYVRQDRFSAGSAGQRYKTYMDADARPRGWKFYQQRHKLAFPPPPVSDRVATTFTPLKAGATFKTRIHVHNLRPAELGALLWALDFGGREECRHGLGLAKPFGYGGVKLKVIRADLRGTRSTGKQQGGLPAYAPVEDLEALRQHFVEHMEDSLGGVWYCSEQIQDLLALARPVPEGQDERLRHMEISHDVYGNEFAGAKSMNLALAPPADRAGLERLRAEGAEERQARMRKVRVREEKKREEKERLQAEKEQREKEERLAAMTDRERAEAEMLEAKAAGRQKQLMKAWMEEGGELESDRRQAAKQVMGKPSGTWKKKNKELWAWLTG